MESWSNARTREDRTRFVPRVSESGRIAESWSSVRKHEDRARLATVEIRTGTLTPESWSSVHSHEDRTHIAVANTRLSRRAGRGAYGAVAVATVAVALLVAVPTAWADGDTSGGTPVATDTTTTSQGQTPGTPDAQPSDAQPSGGQSSSAAGDGGVTSSADNQSSGSNASSSSSDQSAPTTAADAASPTGTTSAGSSDASLPQTPTSQGASSQSATGAATSDQTGAQNTSVTTRTGQGGNDGGATQGNSDASTAASSTSGGTAPAAGGTSSNADAQTTQSGATNTNVDVRVDSPGDVGPTTQSNTAQAAAGSTGDSNAQATQTSPGNINVIVRVGSPGDNGTVDQQNTVTATAGTSTPDPISAGGGATSGSTVQSVPTIGEADSQNGSTTDQQIVQEQGGTAPSVGESPNLISGPVDPTSIGSASVTQTGASNLNVSIRVGSPGTDGLVQQGNTATATGTSPALGVVTSNGGTNSNVTILIPGVVSAPGSDWNWNWTWTSDGTPSLGSTAGDVAPTTGPDWNWSWTPASGTSTPTGSAAGQSATGMFTWTWTWTTADGKTMTWTQQQACDCNWTWTWTWDWSAGVPTQTASETANPDGTSTEPPSSSPAPAATYDIGPVTQQNVSAANAFAGTELISSQTLDQQPGLQGADASQILAVDQQATATAQVSMVDPLNLNRTWGVGSGAVSQANTLEADALAFNHLDATQVVIQQQTQSPSTTQTASGANWAGGEQIAVATADAGSNATANRNIVSAPAGNTAHVDQIGQWNGGLSSATSANWESTTQWIQQFENAGTATAQDEEAVNITSLSQSAISLSLTWQAQVTNLNDLLVPAGSRATNPSVSQSNVDSATTSSLNDDQTQQWISQFQNGEADLEGSLASNQSLTTQSGLEGMTSSQLTTVNRAAWLGVEPTAPPAEGPFNGAPAPDQLTASIQLISSMPRAGIFSLRGPAGKNRHVRMSRLPALSLAVAAADHGTTGSGNAALQANWAAPQAATGGEVLGADSTTHPSGAQTHQGHHRHEDSVSSAPTGTNDLPGSSLGTGTSGSAPSSGGGPVAIFDRTYKFATPAHFGSHVPTLALEPRVESPDPFERPG